MMKHLYYLSLVLLCVACGPKAPTDEQLKDLCRNAAFVISNLEEGEIRTYTLVRIKSSVLSSPL